MVSLVLTDRLALTTHAEPQVAHAASQRHCERQLERESGKSVVGTDDLVVDVVEQQSMLEKAKNAMGMSEQHK